MTNKLCAGAVQVSDTPVSVNSVTSGSVLIAPKVSVNNVNSGGVVIADNVTGSVSVSSGGIIISRGNVRATESSGGLVVSSVQELAEILAHRKRHGRMKDMVKAFEKPSFYERSFGSESKMAKVSNGVSEAKIRGLSLRTSLTLEGAD